jgi:hypothetical protein
MYVNGPGSAQFDRTFSTTGEYANRVGSEYVGAQGQWFHPNNASSTNLSLIQSAGKRRKRRGGRKTKRRGGSRRRKHTRKHH